MPRLLRRLGTAGVPWAKPAPQVSMAATMRHSKNTLPYIFNSCQFLPGFLSAICNFLDMRFIGNPQTQTVLAARLVPALQRRHPLPLYGRPSQTYLGTVYSCDPRTLDTGRFR